MLSLEEGKHKREGLRLGLQETSPTVHTLILKKTITDTRKNLTLFTSPRLFASVSCQGEVRVLTSISTLDFSILFLFVVVVVVYNSFFFKVKRISFSFSFSN